MRLCGCDHPTRNLHSPDRLRCDTCGQWTPHGRAPQHTRLSQHVAELVSIAAHLLDEWQWVEPASLTTVHQSAAGRASGPSDPTGAAAADGQRLAVRSRVVLAARLLERSLAYAKLADEAVGDALYALDAGRGDDRTRGQWWEQGITRDTPVADIGASRPDVRDAQEARGRRWERGEGIPS